MFSRKDFFSSALSIAFIPISRSYVGCLALSGEHYVCRQRHMEDEPRFQRLEHGQQLVAVDCA
ncbi:MAG: hypothetical protein DME48_07810 [Verrucomicrobia bacterium]|nr:MAG: hypothetical protein DME48_07810 [Verrucomicrobiota bacterium]